MPEKIKQAAGLTHDDRQLIAAAKQARLRAHAPWSQFKVGAAARFGAAIVPGCNVEFDVYGLTNCAERSAIFSAFSIGAARKPLTAIAVVADTPEPVLPCGACRQVLFERGGPELRVILTNLRGDVRVLRMQDLLLSNLNVLTRKLFLQAPVFFAAFEACLCRSKLCRCGRQVGDCSGFALQEIKTELRNAHRGSSECDRCAHRSHRSDLPVV